MNPDSSMSLSTMRRHDALCLEFERAWQDNLAPKLEDYLTREPEDKEALLRELLFIEVEYQRRAGERPLARDYSERFPEHNTLVTEVLRDAGGEEDFEGRFRVIDHIAAGGLGEVSLAYDRQLRREVAVKGLLDRHADEAELRRRFVRECYVTSRLEHPGIVPIYHLGSHEDGRPFYAMRFIRGESLEAAVRNAHTTGGPSMSSLRALLRRLIDVTRAVAYAHNQGTLHRDLKPANIMLGPHGETLVVDWGMARSFKDNEARPTPADTNETVTQVGTVLGTPSYMSPEQAAGELSEVGVRSDVYSLGATLYTILTGVEPYRGETFKVLEKVKKGELSRPSTIWRAVPPPLESICLRAMAKSTEDRYPTAIEFAEDLQRWLDDEPVSAHRDPVVVRFGRWARRHRTLAAAMTMLFFSAGVASALGAVVLGEANRRLERSRETAYENIEIARTTVDDLLTQVSEETLLQTPGMQPLRQELLDRALAYYQKFVDQRDARPELRAGLAEGYRRAGQIASDLGQREKGAALMARSIAIHRALFAEWPENPEKRWALARAYDELAKVQLLAGKLDDARNSLKEARAARKGLKEANPRDPELLDVMASNLAQTAYLEWYTDRRQALTTYQRAVRLREQIVSINPDWNGIQAKIAKLEVNIGGLHTELDELDAAVEVLERATGRFRAELDTTPTNLLLNEDLAKALANLGSAHIAVDHPAAAAAAYREATQLFEKLAQANPAVAEYQRNFAQMAITEADFHRKQARPEAARPLLQKAISICQELSSKKASSLEAQTTLGEAYSLLGQVYADMDHYSEALEAFRMAGAVLNPLWKDGANTYVLGRWVNVLFARAELLWSKGQKFLAIDTYREIITHQQTLDASTNEGIKSKADATRRAIRAKLESESKASRSALLRRLKAVPHEAQSEASSLPR